MVPTSLLAFFPPGTAFFVLRSGLGWFFESNDVYVGAFLSHKAHCAAKPDAACCDGRCSALHQAGAAHCVIHSLCRSEGLPAGFYAAFPRLLLCFLRAWAGCKRCWVPPAGDLQDESLWSVRLEKSKREGCRDDIPSRLLLYLVWLACLCARRFGWPISPSKVSPNARVRL